MIDNVRDKKPFDPFGRGEGVHDIKSSGPQRQDRKMGVLGVLICLHKKLTLEDTNSQVSALLGLSVFLIGLASTKYILGHPTK